MTEEEKEICIGKRSGKTYNKIQEMAKEIVKLQKENEELKKTIDLIIDDFQAENYFVGMTNKEVREYYKKRKKLKE